jgi:asparagine synthase (glutamine-hydrolysing)
MFGPADEALTWTMLDALVHRGPDDGHVASGKSFTLGARRLSIVDLSGGRQPLANEDGTIWAAQNGELYNYPDERPRLLQRGHQLRTRCDTELLPHLYEDYGEDFVKHIDGMFAVALWDSKRQFGLLARDRTGKKPLYYTLRPEGLYFASEIKALLRVPGVERRLNLEALHHYLGYKHVPHPLTIFAGIAMLPPAHGLYYRPGGRPRLFRYWRPYFSAEHDPGPAGEEGLIDHLLDLLRQGVKRRLMSDVPIGFFLSGGIDSALSTALAAEMASTRIKTFTLTYGEQSTTAGKEQDRRWARWTAEKYATDHHEERIEFGDFPARFRQILTAFDEPFAGVVSTWFLSQLISRHVKVALAGDGADELFGSYLSHRLAYPLANWARFRETRDEALLRPCEGQRELLERLGPLPDWHWRSELHVFREPDKAELYSPEVRRMTARFSTPAHLRKTWSRLTARDPLNRVLEGEFLTVFPDQVLTFVDRLSMAHSLEVRTAYLDTALIEFAAGLSGRWKIRDGVTKYLLKKAALRYFPEEMVFRPKEGFVLPVNNWLLSGLEPYVRDTLSATALRQHGLFSVSRVEELVNRFYAGHAAGANQILSLLAFQEWYSLYRPAVQPVGNEADGMAWSRSA